MKRKIFIFVGAFLMIGSALIWLGNYRNAPVVTAQTQDITVNSTNGYAVEMQHLLPGREISQKGSAPILSRLDASNRYALERNNLLPGRNVAKMGTVSNLNILDTTDRYALERHNLLPGQEVAKTVAATRLSALDATDRYALEMHNVLPGRELHKDILAIRDATRVFKWSEEALGAGFIQLYDCIEHQTDVSIGAMGVHFIYPSRFDNQLVLEEPEVLVYEQKSDGRMKLVAVEYIIPAAAWSDEAPPVFLGQELKYKTTMGQYGAADGIDPYYEVHVWAWKHNPSGLFADWNPKVSCPVQ